MGTLGCINDMLRRDKENRELRKVSKERLHDTHRRLLSVKEASPLPELSPDDLAEIISRTQARKAAEGKRFFRMGLLFLVTTVIIVLLCTCIFLLIV